MQNTPGEVTTGHYADVHGARGWRLYTPSGDPPPVGRPLVVMLHGCTQDAADFAAGTRADAAGERAGALVLYPEQPATAHPQKCWTWYDRAHQRRGAGEPALLVGLIDHVVKTTGADPTRVYVAGLSAGGSMAQILAAAYPERFAGLAVHSAPPYGSAADVPGALAVLEAGVAEPGALAGRLLEAMGGEVRPMPTLVIQGAEDTVVRAVNGRQVAAQWTTPAAAAGGAVVYREVAGLGHAWSGGAPDGTYTDPESEDATAAVFAFFLGGVPAGR